MIFNRRFTDIVFIIFLVQWKMFHCRRTLSSHQNACNKLIRVIDVALTAERETHALVYRDKTLSVGVGKSEAGSCFAVRMSAFTWISCHSMIFDSKSQWNRRWNMLEGLFIHIAHVIITQKTHCIVSRFTTSLRYCECLIVVVSQRARSMPRFRRWKIYSKMSHEHSRPFQEKITFFVRRRLEWFGGKARDLCGRQVSSLIREILIWLSSVCWLCVCMCTV